MRERPAICAALAAAVALAVSACGSAGSPGDLAAKPPQQIVAQASRAINGAHSVRVTGSVADGASPDAINLDLDLVSGRGATGSMSQSGLGLRLVVVGKDAYVNGSAGFWKRFGGAGAVARLRGRWVKAPANSGAFASFASLTDLHKLLGGLLNGHGALTKGSTTTVDGRKVITVKDAGRNGTLYVAAGGTPYPVEIVDSGAGGGRIAFSRFDRPVDLVRPPRSIDITTPH